MYRNVIHTGRLVESTIASPLSERECTDSLLQARMLLLSIPGRAVVAVDLTGLQVLPQELTSMVEQMFRRDNTKIERSGILVSPRYPSASMQITRLAQRADNPDRRVFELGRRDEMVAWLSAALTPAEQARLRQFAAEIGAPERAAPAR